MPYPSAPWTRQGYGIQTLHLVNIERSRPFIPAESPFFDIGLGQPFLTVRYEQMKLSIDAPKVVGQRTSVVSYR